MRVGEGNKGILDGVFPTFYRRLGLRVAIQAADNGFGMRFGVDKVSFLLARGQGLIICRWKPASKTYLFVVNGRSKRQA